MLCIAGAVCSSFSIAAGLESLPDAPSALKAIIVAQHEEIARLAAAERAYEALIEALKTRIARLKRQKFGSSSEKIEHEIEQLELALEDLEAAMAAADTSPEPEKNETEEVPSRSRRRRGQAARVGDNAARAYRS